MRLPGIREAGSRACTGFTLVEVTAAMLIVALVASLAVVKAPGTGRTALKSVALQAASLMRRERLSAVLTGRPRNVMLDGDQRALIAEGGGRVAIPPDVKADVLGAASSDERRVPVVVFLPDGASTGGVLRLSREGAGYDVRVNWFLGSVSVIDQAL